MSVGIMEADQEMDPSILPGLPDDLALLCLVRIPRRWHFRLGTVCKLWKSTFESSEFSHLRRKMSLTEEWIYVLSRDTSEILHWHALDPAERNWQPLPPMPGSFPRHYGVASAVLGQQLFVLGGGKRYTNPTADVIVYDPSNNEWREAADLHIARSYFVCATFEDRLYAVGGMGAEGMQTSWEVYDPATNSWSSFQDSNIVSDLGEYLVHDRRLYVRHVCLDNFQYHLPPTYAAVYNPEVNAWFPLDNDMTKKWHGTAVVTSRGEVYMLDQTFGLKMMTLDKESLTWTRLGRLEPSAAQSPCRMSAAGQKLYIIGKGLKTTVLDLETVRHGDGVLVASSFRGPLSPLDLILCCHVLRF